MQLVYSYPSGLFEWPVAISWLFRDLWNDLNEMDKFVLHVCEWTLNNMSTKSATIFPTLLYTLPSRLFKSYTGRAFSCHGVKLMAMYMEPGVHFKLRNWFSVHIWLLAIDCCLWCALDIIRFDSVNSLETMSAIVTRHYISSVLGANLYIYGCYIFY